MATDKTFNVCGVSKLDGEYKVRFANDVMRIKVLNKHGHEDITLVELPNEMTKLDAAKFIAGLDEFSNVNAQAAIADYLDRNDAKPKKAAKATGPATKQVKSTAKTKAPSTSAVEAAVAELEDAPF